MANTTVTKVSELLLTNVTAGVKAGDAKVSDAQGFSEVMNNAKDSTEKVQPQDDTKTTRTVVETPKSKEIKAEEPVKRDPIANESDRADFTEEVAEDIKEIVNTIKEVLEVSDEELERRRAAWKAPEPKVKTGYLARYAKLVSSADKGAILE